MAALVKELVKAYGAEAGVTVRQFKPQPRPGKCPAFLLYG